MKHTSSVTKTLRLAAKVGPLAAIAFFIGWSEFMGPAVRPYIERAIGKEIYRLPDFAGFLYYATVGLLPPLLITFGVYAVAYLKWYMPNRTRLAYEQLQSLAQERSALTSALGHIESFERELQEKATQAEKLRDELESLQLLNAESTIDLERKLKAMELLARNRIWFERILAFVIGILSSLAASYM